MQILLLLGSTALNAIIGNEIVISKARGKWIYKKLAILKQMLLHLFILLFNETTRSEKICLGRFKND